MELYPYITREVMRCANWVAREVERRQLPMLADASVVLGLLLHVQVRPVAPFVSYPVP
jgi:hypothetical protein